MAMATGIRKREGKRGVSYEVVLDVGYDPATGKRRQETKTFETEKEAKLERAKMLVAARNNTLLADTKMSVAELFERWLDVWQGTNPKPHTVSGYQWTITHLILPLIGKMPVQKVRPASIDAMNAQLRVKGCSNDALHRCHQRLKQAFDFAVKRQIVAVNPMSVVDAPRVRSASPIILTVPQIGRFLTYAAQDGCNPLWLLILQTGMRRGEALGVRWRDLDVDKGKMRVEQQVNVLKGAPYIDSLKTPSADRTLTLFKESIAALRTHKERQALQRTVAGENWRDLDLIFTTATGGPLNPNNVFRSLGAIQTKANKAAATDDELLPKFDIHDLRHTHATHLLHEGWPITVVSRRLGHANPAITMRIYAHALTDMQGDASVTPTAFAFAGTGV